MIRPATPDDEPALRRLDRSNWSFEHSPAPLPPPDKPFEIEGTTVSEIEGVIAGYVRIGPALRIPATDHVLEVKGLLVEPAYRGHGMGKALMFAAIAQATEAGARKLTLRVLGSNPQAQAIYEACGFAEEGRQTDYFYLDGRYVDDVLMALTIVGRVDA